MNAISKDSSLDSWILTASDHAFVMAKHHGNRLGFAVLLFLPLERRRFPRNPAEIEPTRILEVADQIAINAPADLVLSMTGRTVERQRADPHSLWLPEGYGGRCRSA